MLPSASFQILIAQAALWNALVLLVGLGLAVALSHRSAGRAWMAMVDEIVGHTSSTPSPSGPERQLLHNVRHWAKLGHLQRAAYCQEELAGLLLVVFGLSLVCASAAAVWVRA